MCVCVFECIVGYKRDVITIVNYISNDIASGISEGKDRCS